MYPAAAKEALSFEIRDVDTRGKSPHGPLSVELAALAPLVIDTATRQPKGGVVGPLKIEPGESGLKVSLRRTGGPVITPDLPRAP